MQMVKTADLKNNLSRHLGRVRRGETLTVLDRDTPIARIVPFDHGDRAASGGAKAASGSSRMAELVREGVATPGDGRAVSRWVQEHRPAVRPGGAPTAVDVLVRMRRESTR